jgi:UPF0042 nucleotide-binding protein
VTDTGGGARDDAAPANLVIITGMSGAGRSEAIHTFEDLGYFCIDNLPPALIGSIVDLTRLAGSRISDVAVVCDARGMEFFAELWGELERLERDGVPFRILFLEAEDEMLVQRFKETRRRHPLTDEGTVLDGIEAERDLLEDFRGRADLVIDTTDLRPTQLRQRIIDDFLCEKAGGALDITVSSFGFKYGVPIDADIVMDVRFLPNPFYDALLRPLSGLDGPVRDYVLARDETIAFLEGWFHLLEALMPGYHTEGKSHLAMAMGCTGGRHRSVVLAEETADFLRELGYPVRVTHRDLERDPQRHSEGV